MKLVISENQLKNLVNVITEASDNKKKVLFVGDSLSAGPNWTWNYQLSDKYPDWQVTHIAKPGITTNTMKNLLVNELQNKKYDFVFIWGGTNDMFSNIIESDTIENLKEMARMVKKQGGTTFILSGYDVASVMTDEKLKKLYESGKTLCDSVGCILRGKRKLLNLQDLIERGIPNAKVIKRISDDNLISNDGIHLGTNGNSIIANKVANYLLGKLEKEKETSDKSFLGLGLLDKIKNFLLNPFGFLGGKKDLTNDLIKGLESIREFYFKPINTSIISEEKTYEYVKGKPMEQSKAIEYIQTALQLLGFSLPKYGIDGVFGPETKQAVKKFQKELGTQEDGKVTSDLADELIQTIRDKGITDEDFVKLQLSKTGSYDEVSELKLSGDKYEKQAYQLHGEEFIGKVKEIAKKVSMNYKLILATMAHESGFNPSAQNPDTKATGLIQFIPTTASKLGTSVGELKNMSALEQLKYVEDFYMGHNRAGLTQKVKSVEDSYFLVFYPRAVGESDDFVLGSEVSPGRVKLIAQQNKGFDKDKKGFITVGDVKKFIRKNWSV